MIEKNILIKKDQVKIQLIYISSGGQLDTVSAVAKPEHLFENIPPVCPRLV